MKTAEQHRGDALAVFAHELRQPLASILFAVQSMEEEIEDEDAHREMRAVVKRQACFLSQMIEDVLEVGGSQHGHLHLDKARVDLRSLIAGAIEATEPLLTTRRHRLTVSLPDQAPSVIVDPLRMQQVITNLLVNAAKYTEPGGCISLRVEAAPELVEIEVRDNGIGITPDFLPRVFDMYEQAGTARQHDRGGLGIGLALVKSLVELHGGSVSAQSDGQGAGSAFVVRLPCVSGRGLIAREVVCQPRPLPASCPSI